MRSVSRRQQKYGQVQAIRLKAMPHLEIESGIQPTMGINFLSMYATEFAFTSSHPYIAEVLLNGGDLAALTCVSLMCFGFLSANIWCLLVPLAASLTLSHIFRGAVSWRELSQYSVSEENLVKVREFDKTKEDALQNGKQKEIQSIEDEISRYSAQKVHFGMVVACLCVSLAGKILALATVLLSYQSILKDLQTNLFTVSISSSDLTSLGSPNASNIVRNDTIALSVILASELIYFYLLESIKDPRACLEVNFAVFDSIAGYLFLLVLRNITNSNQIHYFNMIFKYLPWLFLALILTRLAAVSYIHVFKKILTKCSCNKEETKIQPGLLDDDTVTIEWGEVFLTLFDILYQISLSGVVIYALFYRKENLLKTIGMLALIAACERLTAILYSSLRMYCIRIS